MLSKWAYVLIGNNNTGKTTFQKKLVLKMCGRAYNRLDCNKIFEITHPDTSRRLSTISVMNRSFQEKTSEYGDVRNFFAKYFQIADICILSSHAGASDISDIKCLIAELRSIYYNVAGIFFSNALDKNTSLISGLDWNERFMVENPPTTGNHIESQLTSAAEQFSNLLIRRANIQ